MISKSIQTSCHYQLVGLTPGVLAVGDVQTRPELDRCTAQERSLGHTAICYQFRFTHLLRNTDRLLAAANVELLLTQSANQKAWSHRCLIDSGASHLLAKDWLGNKTWSRCCTSRALQKALIDRAVGFD